MRQSAVHSIPVYHHSICLQERPTSASTNDNGRLSGAETDLYTERQTKPTRPVLTSNASALPLQVTQGLITLAYTTLRRPVLLNTLMNGYLDLDHSGPVFQASTW